MTYYRKTTRIRSPDHCRRISEARQRGVYHTAWGSFPTAKEAVAAIDLNIGQPTIIRMCRLNQRIITKQSYGCNQFLQTIGDWTIGKTYRQVGFSFEPKKGANRVQIFGNR